METAFSKVVERVFSNWSALRLSVEHNMAGSNSFNSVREFVDYTAKYCSSNSNVDRYEIQEVLEDILDQEFDTSCEDDSPQEVACILERFLGMWNQGNMAQFEIEYNNLPVIKDWILTPTVTQVEEEVSSSDSSDDDQMDVANTEASEPGWTQVKTRRRRQ